MKCNFNTFAVFGGFLTRICSAPTAHVSKHAIITPQKHIFARDLVVHYKSLLMWTLKSAFFGVSFFKTWETCSKQGHFIAVDLEFGICKFWQNLNP